LGRRDCAGGKIDRILLFTVMVQRFTADQSNAADGDEATELAGSESSECCESQHERNIVNHFNFVSVRPEVLEGRFFSNVFSKRIAIWVEQRPDGMIRALLCSRSTAFPNGSLFFTLADGTVWVFSGPSDTI